jgi:hypothetical protein
MAAFPASRVLPVRLFSQADNIGGEGYKECMTSSCAMLASFYGAVRSDDEYNRVRRRYGASIDPAAQVAALRAFGLSALFYDTWDRARLESELKYGRPVAVGWLHQGTPMNPTGFGHWTVAAGWSPSAVWMLDPNGEADLARGGYVSSSKGWSGWYSWRNWGPRWDKRAAPVPGRPSRPAGWAITAQPSPLSAAPTHGTLITA